MNLQQIKVDYNVYINCLVCSYYMFWYPYKIKKSPYILTS